MRSVKRDKGRIIFNTKLFEDLTNKRTFFSSLSFKQPTTISSTSFFQTRIISKTNFFNVNNSQFLSQFQKYSTQTPPPPKERKLKFKRIEKGNQVEITFENQKGFSEEELLQEYSAEKQKEKEKKKKERLNDPLKEFSRLVEKKKEEKEDFDILKASFIVLLLYIGYILLNEYLEED